jgi:Protein of unknown function (DUF2905)
MELQLTGRLFLLLGVGLLLVGGLLLLASRVSFFNNFGSLPGDIRFQSGSFTCFAPIISTCILSIVATLILNLIAWLASR